MMTAAFSRRFILPALLLGAALSMSGCASAPVQEMSNARQALKVAGEAGAMASTSAPYREAQALLRSAEQNLENHSYRAARHDAVRAKALAIQATDSSVASDQSRDD